MRKYLLTKPIRVRTYDGDVKTIELSERFANNVYYVDTEDKRPTGLVEPEFTLSVKTGSCLRTDFSVLPEMLESSFTELTPIEDGQRYLALKDTTGHVHILNKSPSPVPIKKGDVVRVYIYGHDVSFVMDNAPDPFRNRFDLVEVSAKASMADFRIPDPAFFELLPA